MHRRREATIARDDSTIPVVPLYEMSRNGMGFPATRGSTVGESDVVEYLAAIGSTLVVVVDHTIEEWVHGPAAIDLWEYELKPRLIAPELREVCLGEYPDRRCYAASEWFDERGFRFFVFDLHC